MLLIAHALNTSTERIDPPHEPHDDDDVFYLTSVCQSRGLHYSWYEPSVLALNQLRGRARPARFPDSVCLKGSPRRPSPGHNRMHIGFCLMDTHSHVAIARLRLEGISTMMMMSFICTCKISPKLYNPRVLTSHHTRLFRGRSTNGMK